jgi:acetyl-CoA decarbonylase/synthase complex subunit delta
MAKKEAEEQAIREKRAKEREALAAKHGSAPAEVSMTPAAQQKSKLDKMLDRLNRIHKRVA